LAATAAAVRSAAQDDVEMDDDESSGGIELKKRGTALDQDPRDTPSRPVSREQRSTSATANTVEEDGLLNESVLDTSTVELEIKLPPVDMAPWPRPRYHNRAPSLRFEGQARDWPSLWQETAKCVGKLGESFTHTHTLSSFLCCLTPTFFSLPIQPLLSACPFNCLLLQL
jgi:hypothetical protein